MHFRKLDATDFQSSFLFLKQKENFKTHHGGSCMSLNPCQAFTSITTVAGNIKLTKMIQSLCLLATLPFQVQIG